jgi:hypothetical protein
VPKHDVVLQPGDAVPAEFADLIRDKLGEEQLCKLQQHGGLIRISVVAPYVARGKDSPTVEVHEDFVKGLYAIRQDRDSLEGRIRNLRIKELKSICRIIDIPIRSKASGQEIRAQIVDFIRSGDKWNAIAES